MVREEVEGSRKVSTGMNTRSEMRGQESASLTRAGGGGEGAEEGKAPPSPRKRTVRLYEATESEDKEEEEASA